MSIAENMKTIADTARMLAESDNTNSHQSIIHWQKGEPKEHGNYIVSFKDGSVGSAYFAQWAIQPNFWEEHLKKDVIAWCKLSDIEPYKENKEE